MSGAVPSSNDIRAAIGELKRTAAWLQGQPSQHIRPGYSYPTVARESRLAELNTKWISVRELVPPELRAGVDHLITCRIGTPSLLQDQTAHYCAERIEPLCKSLLACAEWLAEHAEASAAASPANASTDAPPVPDDGHDWVPASEIVRIYSVSKTLVSRWGKKNSKICRDAKRADRKKWEQPKLQYVYKKQAFFEALERAPDAE